MIRKYSIDDKSRVINLFRKNTPEYFDVSEEKDFDNYLENEIEDYFVYEKYSGIIGAGGINYFKNDIRATISWDVIDPKFQGIGIGGELLKFRIKYLTNTSNIKLLEVRTSQMVYKFYEKFGFELESVHKDYWAKNFDLYKMKMTLENS